MVSYTRYLSIIFSGTEEFNEKVDLTILMTIFSYVKHRYVIRLKFGGRFFISLTTLGLQAKASICSTKKNVPLYCRKSSAFVMAVII